MKEIKLKTIYANEEQNGSPGDTIEVPDEEYDALIAGKYGEAPDKKKEVEKPEESDETEHSEKVDKKGKSKKNKGK
ncbi:MAG: hypothetical protein GY760_14205 [Deltaproteobacteria bacterium]|nr:hypothetical protein [Deltaproteobacteria bacterium]